MLLLDHVSIVVRDLSVARPFYDAIMQALGATKVYDREGALGYGERCSAEDPLSTCLAVYAASEDLSPHDRRHWCFKASSRGAVDAFYQAGLEQGGCGDGAPGLRPDYHANYYGAFLRDPDGNRVEAVFHGASPRI